jgi:excisionase family DNA binding protein
MMRIQLPKKVGHLVQPVTESTPALQTIVLPTELMTVAEAAVYAKVSQPTIRRWIRCEGLVAYGGPKRIRIDRVDLLKFLGFEI